MSDFTRNLRDRHADLVDLSDRLPTNNQNGQASMVVRTVAVSSYPIATGVFYACTPIDPGGIEAEGSAAILSAGSGTMYFLHLGSVVPPVGTNLVVDSVNGRWVSRWD